MAEADELFQDRNVLSTEVLHGDFKLWVWSLVFLSSLKIFKLEVNMSLSKISFGVFSSFFFEDHFLPRIFFWIVSYPRALRNVLAVSYRFYISMSWFISWLRIHFIVRIYTAKSRPFTPKRHIFFQVSASHEVCYLVLPWLLRSSSSSPTVRSE